MARSKRVPEPGEPSVGAELLWMKRGAGWAYVVRVTRRGGRWVSVTVRWPVGCCLGPAYPGQPQAEWELPYREERISREAWESITPKKGTWDAR